MNFKKLNIPDIVLIKPEFHQDERGFFCESFREDKFQSFVGLKRFVQDNHTSSKKNVLRGLHYQIKQPQGKIVRVIKGKIFDVAVDLRKKSKYFLKWVGVELSSENNHQLWIPEGFAHGFLTLSDDTEVLYKTTDYYSKNDERTIIWNDKDINIDWPLIEKPIISNKDEKGLEIKLADLFYV